MKPSTTLHAVVTVCAISCAPLAQATTTYDFAYELSGDRALLPAKIFSDEGQTFIEFRGAKPSIYTADACGQQHLLSTDATVKGPFLVLPGIYNSYTLRAGERTATIDYIGKNGTVYAEGVSCAPKGKPVQANAPKAVKTPKPEAVTVAAPIKTMPAPVVAETAEAVLPTAVTNTPVAPIAAPVMVATTPAAPVTPQQKWELLPSDGTIFNALNRWAKSIDYTLIWDTEGHDFPIVGKTSFSGDLEGALAGIADALKTSHYPIRACAFDNNTVRVIHKTRQCRD